MIDRSHALPITRQAQALGISRGARYYTPHLLPAGDLALPQDGDGLLFSESLLLHASSTPLGGSGHTTTEATPFLGRTSHRRLVA